VAADGGGKVTAARPAAGGAPNVAGWLLALARRPPQSMRMALVNGAPGLVMLDADGLLTVIAFTIDAGRITALDVMRNPDKLAGVPEPG
jgi:RNA polymerase sigma-70 factor, ECF subfamily